MSIQKLPLGKAVDLTWDQAKGLKKSQRLAHASILPSNGKMKALDITRVAPEYALPMLISSIRKIYRRLDKAIAKNNQPQIIKLTALLLDKQARLQKEQAQVTDRELTLNLTNDPKAVRLSPSVSRPGKIERRRGHMKYRRPVGKRRWSKNK